MRKKHNLGYSEKHDAYFLLDSGRWLEPVCSDVSCVKCQSRPERAPDERETVLGDEG